MIHPNSRSTASLQTVADSMGFHVHISRMDIWERNYRATLTPQQLRDYRVHTGELADTCPNCGTRYVEVKTDEFPDMAGTTTIETFPCCGYVSSFNDFLVYRDGIAVDIR